MEPMQLVGTQLCLYFFVCCSHVTYAFSAHVCFVTALLKKLTSKLSLSCTLKVVVGYLRKTEHGERGSLTTSAKFAAKWQSKHG